MEGIGGIMVYNISDPNAPIFLEYENNRDNTPGGNESGDLGPEGILYISPADSPTGNGLLVVSNEVSATISVYSIDNDVLSVVDNQIDSIGFAMFPNPASGQVFFSVPGDYELFDISGRSIRKVKDAVYMEVSSLRTGTYIMRNKKGVTKKLTIM
ncbi:MAG: T9SS C-terminal target domain-containing protein [Flavobacterium sp.]|nr:MAG: T9SS C-terminal target domain-containing protein [Flavobacterium sp.]